MIYSTTFLSYKLNNGAINESIFTIYITILNIFSHGEFGIVISLFLAIFLGYLALIFLWVLKLLAPYIAYISFSYLWLDWISFITIQLFYSNHSIILLFQWFLWYILYMFIKTLVSIFIKGITRNWYTTFVCHSVFFCIICLTSLLNIIVIGRPI